jgi:hypothetical protein
MTPRHQYLHLAVMFAQHDGSGRKARFDLGRSWL